MIRKRCTQDFQRLLKVFEPDTDYQKQQLINNLEACSEHYEFTLPYKNRSLRDILGSGDPDLEQHYSGGLRASVHSWDAVSLPIKKELFKRVGSKYKVTSKSDFRVWIGTFIDFIEKKSTSLMDIDACMAFIFDTPSLKWLTTYSTMYFATAGRHEVLEDTYFVHFSGGDNIYDIVQSQSFLGRSDPRTLLSTFTMDSELIEGEGYMYGYNLGTNSKSEALFLLDRLLFGNLFVHGPFDLYRAYEPYAVIAKASKSVRVYNVYDQEDQLLIPVSCVDLSTITYVRTHKGYQDLDL